MLFDTSYQSQNTIWLTKVGFATTGIVNDPNAKADQMGQKYIKAGTLLASTGNFRSDGTQLLQPTTDPSTAQGVLVQDTNITRGNTRAAVATAGNLNRHWMDSDVKAVYSDANIPAIEKQLPKITVFDRY